jgi:hypothetical protein
VDCNCIIIIIIFLHYYYGSRESAVGIATGHGLGGRFIGVRVPVKGEFFPIFTLSRSVGPLKRPGRETVHSPPASVEVKNM